MIVADSSTAFPELSEQLKQRLIVLYQMQDCVPYDRTWNLLNLVRRAWRPLHHELRRQYIMLWGKNASFSYFFPQHTFNAISRQARAEIKASRELRK